MCVKEQDRMPKANLQGMMGKYEKNDLPKIIEYKFCWSKIKTGFTPTYVKNEQLTFYYYFIFVFVTLFLTFIGHLISPA